MVLPGLSDGVSTLRALFSGAIVDKGKSDSLRENLDNLAFTLAYQFAPQGCQVLHDCPLTRSLHPPSASFSGTPTLGDNLPLLPVCEFGNSTMEANYSGGRRQPQRKEAVAFVT